MFFIVYWNFFVIFLLVLYGLFKIVINILKFFWVIFFVIYFYIIFISIEKLFFEKFDLDVYIRDV